MVLSSKLQRFGFIPSSFMDIVIPLSEETGTNFAELRFALRSFELYLPHSHLVLVGGLPEWLWPAAKQNLLTHIAFVDSNDPKFREANIFLKVRHYIEKFNESDDFIFCNDDYYLTKEWNPFPPYPHKGTLRDCLKLRSTMDPYRKTISNTIQLIGSEIFNLDVHAPMCMHPELFKKVFGDRTKKEEYEKRLVKWATPYGFLFKTLYGCHHAIKKEITKDVKFNLLKDVPTTLHPDVEFFSSNDPAYGPKLEKLLLKLYPKPSRYEL